MAQREGVIGVQVWIELFLLDNALMGFLILRTAEAFAPKKLRRLPTAGAVLVGAAAAAAGMKAPLFLSPFAKLLLLFVMTAAFWPKGLRAWGRCALCVLLATFAMGGLFYALCGLFAGSLASGVLYAGVSLRAVLCALCAATFLPRLVRSINARKRLQSEVAVTLSAGSARVTVTGRVDTGNLLKEPLTGLPVVVADRARCSVLFAGGLKLPVAYRALGGEGCMDGVLGTICAEGLEETRCCIAQSPEGLGECGAVINAELFALWGGKPG